jgi:histidyl-tRNA synthetase
MRKIITPVKGTRDFYPDLMAVRTWLYDNLRKVSESFGYQEYEAPFLETLALYAAKSGEELVKEQSYVFEDRSGDSIALRPELTPSLARMIAQKENELTFPVRWWSFGPFWRYERPQKGRTREFFQWNVDLLGVNSPEADAELIAVAASFFKRVGLKPDQSRIYVNNRRLMESQFTRLGFTRDMHPVVSNIVDRRSKLGADKWNAYALEEGLTNDQLVDLKNLLDNKNIWHESDELVRLFATLKALNVCDFVEFDANIMRGLLYYTGTVFEAFDISGSVRRSILGGGRYDNLLADVGGEPLSGVGFAMGDVVVSLILQENGLVPTFETTPAQVLVTVFSKEYLSESYALGEELRHSGLNVICYPEPVKLSKQFKFADHMRTRLVLVLGPDESAKGLVTIKDLVQGTQRSTERGKAARTVKEMLA